MTAICVVAFMVKAPSIIYINGFLCERHDITRQSYDIITSCHLFVVDILPALLVLLLVRQPSLVAARQRGGPANVSACVRIDPGAPPKSMGLWRALYVYRVFVLDYVCHRVALPSSSPQNRPPSIDTSAPSDALLGRSPSLSAAAAPGAGGGTAYGTGGLPSPASLDAAGDPLFMAFSAREDEDAAVAEARGHVAAHHRTDSGAHHSEMHAQHDSRRPATPRMVL